MSGHVSAVKSLSKSNYGSQRAKGLGSILTMSFGRPRIKRKALADFTRSLATLLEAGLPLIRALKTMERQSRDPLEKATVAEMCLAIESGSTLSEAMGQQARSFSRMYVSMIRAGEASGALEKVLDQLASSLERMDALVGKVRAAMVYPAVVLFAAVTITAGLMVFVIPRFALIFKDIMAGAELPLITRFVMGLSHFLAQHFFLGLVIGCAGIATMRVALRWRPVQLLVDAIKLKMPPFGKLLTQFVTARVCANLSTLLGAGVSVLPALQICRDTAGNTTAERALQMVHDAVKEGEGIAKPLSATGVFPEMVVSMVHVGEETGALPAMLDRIARTYEERVNRTVDALTSLIEPIMILVLGGLIGTIVLSVFLPLLNIIMVSSS